MSKETNRWQGKPPKRCDSCNRAFTEKDQHFFDAKTKRGPWGVLCQQCWNLHGVGLGVGLGQKYELKTLAQVAGGKAQAMEPVESLEELRTLATNDARYRKLLFLSSSNLGGPSEDVEKCFQWLVANANETTEEGVVAEVNACLDLVGNELEQIKDASVSLKGVRSMPELRRLCRDHEEYQRVVMEASGKLAGPEASFRQAWRWLTAVAMAGSDSTVLEVVNECVKQKQ